MRFSLVIFLIFICGLSVHAQRTSDGLILSYEFNEATKSFYKDTSNLNPALHLKVENDKRVQSIDHGIRLLGGSKLSNAGNASRVAASLQRSNALSVEAWIRPASLNQAGPARIFTFSQDGSNRNFTLGQEGKKIDFRLRTSSTSSNGLPSLASKSDLKTNQPTHVVFTRAKSGETKLYINGRIDATSSAKGNLKNWNKSYKLAVGDEFTGGRNWKGSVFLVAVYDRALPSHQVIQNFKAGFESSSEEDPVSLARSEKEVFFETQVAPLISKHCLECHDSGTRKGKLDLSRKALALAGGKNGDTIIPGDSDKSEFYLTVLHDEMPEERDPLSKEEKEVFKKWIDDGAVWSIDFIDQALYAHGREGGEEVLRRLTIIEYIRSVQTLFDVDIEKEARQLLPADLRADGFSNTAYNLNVDLKHIENYAELASIIVSRLDVEKFAKKFTKNIGFTDNQMGDLLNRMGKVILRGPLEEHELFAYRGISTTVAGSGGDYFEAIGYIIEAMLQSPRFIYRVENQKGDGTRWPVNEFELASRLSYLIWGTAPDKRLIDAAEAGELIDEKGILSHTDRMLKDSRAITRSQEFLNEWMNFGRLYNMNPDPAKYPDWNSELAHDMHQESIALFTDLIWDKKKPIHDLFNADYSYLTPRLAKHYKLHAQVIPDGLDSTEVFKVVFPPESGRSGILTHGSLLTVGGDEASMVARGLFVMHELLRGVVKDPPPCVDTTPKPAKSGLTQRNIAQERIDNKSCGGCHAKFEPLAFGFEKFDGLGSFHLKDEFGNKLRSDGNVLVPGASESIAYTTSTQLADILAKSERVRQTISWKATQFALGRPLNAQDAPYLEMVYTQWQKNGGTYQELIKAIAVSDLVLTKSTASE